MTRRFLPVTALCIVAATGTAVASAPATGTSTAATAAPAGAASAATASAESWHSIYHKDFGTLDHISAFTSTATLNSTLRPTDTNQSLLQKPTLAANVAIVDDAGTADGKAMVVRTQRAHYWTTSGRRWGWTNGRLMLRDHDESPPVRIQARVRFTPSVGTKTAVMWWPATGGWRWEVDFAETFGGRTLTDYWGGRQHVSQRWHGDGPDPDHKANEQLIRNLDLDGTRYHLYDLYILPDRMRVEVDGLEVFSTTDKQYLPQGPGFFSVGKAVEGRRSDTGRTQDAVYVDWLQIDKPS